MRKYIYACGIMFFCAIAVCGCAHVPDLTDEQNSQIAEYMAASLLKYDENYDAVLEYDESVLEITPTPVPTPEPEPTQAPEESTEPAQDGNAGNGGTGTAATPAALSEDLSAVFDSDEYVVTAESAELVGNHYKGTYVTIDAAEGKCLMAVTFKIKNTADSSVKLNMTDKESRKNPIKFTASVNGEILSPLPTMISNDLQYYKDEIPAGKSRSAVLLFELDKDTDIDELTVIASNEKTQAAMQVE